MKNEKTKVMLYWPFSKFEDVHLYKDPGGIPRALSDLNIDTSIIVGKFLSSADIKTKIYETLNEKNMNIFSYPTEIVKVLKIIIKEKPRAIIVYNHSPLNFIIISMLKFYYLFKMRKCRIMIYIKMDSDGSVDHLHPLIRFLYIAMIRINSKLADRIIVETSCAYNRISEMIKGSERLFVLPDGYSNIIYKTIRYIDSRREKRVLSVSRITRQKGIDTLIKAFSLSIKDFPDWKLTIIGEVTDTEYFHELQQLTCDLGIVSKVDFLGRVSLNTLKEYYGNSSIFCLLSIQESYGIARTEAIINGLPIITTEAGCGETLKDYGSIVVKINDITAASYHLSELMSSEELRKKISDKQITAIRSWSDIANQLILDIKSHFTR